MTDTNGNTNGANTEDSPSSRGYGDLFPNLQAEPKKQLSCFKPKAGSLVGRQLGSRTNQTTKSVTIPRSERKHPANMSTSANEIRRQCGQVGTLTKCSIIFSENKDDSLQVIIRGPSDKACETARAKIRAVLQSQDTLEINIEKKYHKFILGKGGNALRDLESRTGTKVRIPGPNDNSATISISGPKEGITQARQGIMDIVKKQGSRAMERLDIPKLYHPFITGAHNKVKENIELQCGAVKVNVPPGNKPEATEISINGDKDAVAAAKVMVLAIYEKKRDKLTEVSVDIPKAQHRHVIGPKAAGIHDILEKFECLVDVPKADDQGNETITLRGEAMNIGQALNEVYFRANSYVQNTVPAPSWCMRKLIGKGGAGIKALNPYNSGENFVKVDFIDEKDQIEISGMVKPVEEVTKAIKTRIREILITFTQREIKIPQSFHGRVIGQKGENLKKFREGREGLNVRVPNADSNSDVIVIEGKPEDVNVVFKELAALAQDFSNEKEVKLNLDHKYHLYFFRGNSGPDKGKKERFEDMKSKFSDQINIKFPDKESDSNEVIIRGPNHIVDFCAKELELIYKEIVNEHYIGNLLVQKKFHRNIIGKGGSVISVIKDECEVNIDIPANDSNSEIIKVIGTKSNVERAKQKIREIENTLAAVTEVRVKIPKTSYKYLIGQGGAKISVLRDEFGVAIQFPDENSNSDMVIIRGDNKDNVEAAKEKLEVLAKEKVQNYHTAEIACPQENRKFLVGKRGATRMALQQEFAVSLNIPDGVNDKISIVGKKADVAKAQAELESRIKTLNDKKEEVITVPKKYHVRLIRDNILNHYNDDFQTRVQLPNAQSESDEVKVKGPKKNVDIVVKKLGELLKGFESESTIEFELPTKERRALIGEQGSTVNALQEKYSVSISIKPKDNGEEEETTLATVTGPKDQLDAVKEELFSLVTYNEDIDLPSDYHGLLLGVKGQKVQELSRRLHITIKVPKKDDENKDVIRIRGTRANLAIAKAELEKLKSEWKLELDALYLRSYQCEVEVPEIFHRKLIGQKGEHIKFVQERHDVKIKIPKDKGEGPEIVFVTGLQENVHACVDELNRFVQDLVSHVTKDVEIDNDVHKRIIGQRGRGVRKLMKEYDVDIVFPRDSADEKSKNIVSVSGLNTNVDDAIEALTDLEDKLLQETGDDAIDVRYRPDVPGQQAFRDRQDFENKEKTKKNRPQRTREQFKVHDAPWNAPQQAGDVNTSEAFPSLGSGGDQASKFMGAWGNRR